MCCFLCVRESQLPRFVSGLCLSYVGDVAFSLLFINHNDEEFHTQAISILY